MVGNMFSCILLDNNDLSIQENKARELERFYPRDVSNDHLIEKVHSFNTPQNTIFKQRNPLQLLNKKHREEA